MSRVEPNPALFGADPMEGIVAVETAGDTRVRLYRRRPDGAATEEDSLRPFLLLESPDLLEGWRGETAFQRLSGDWDYRFVALFPGWRALQSAVKHLKGGAGTDAGAPFLLIADPIQQYLTFTGRTLYKGMGFEDLRRLQIDIETTVSDGFEFPNAQREGDRITLVSLCDSTGWESSLRGDRLTEPEMIRNLGELVRQRDPDVIEGHNLFNFDLPYLRARARRHGIDLRWGRDGSVARFRPSRFSVAERVLAYQRCDVGGRQLVDTLFLVQLYDVATRELESFGLKSVARHFGVASEDRVYLDPREIPGLFATDMERLVAYGLGDVRETGEISRILGQSHFYQTQMFPLSYQNVVSRGNATRIDSLFLREYLRQGHSVPRCPARAQYAGGYADLFATGVVGPIVHCDVQSLYPSVMISFGITPARDTLGVFQRLLRDLTRRRLEAKERARTERAPRERAYWEAFQGALKVLINSFYGYLGFPQGHFADFEAAARVTAEGRSIIRRVLDDLRSRGAAPVEVDTDGVYFVPPREVLGPEAESRLVAEISAGLPEGIRLEAAGRYPSMFSYRVKNYVLLTYQGAVQIHGSGLRSRGLEKFQRKLLADLFRAVMEGRSEDLPALKDVALDDLRNHRWTPDVFAKTETLHDSLPTYLEKRRANSRNTSAAYELALASGRPHQPGDQVTYYVAGRGSSGRVFERAKLASAWDPRHPDEDIEYYGKKIADLYRKFAPLLRNQAGSGQLEFELEVKAP